MINWGLIEDYSKSILSNFDSGHDYLHALRVWKNAQDITGNYNSANTNIIKAACLTHDCIDHKFISDPKKSKKDLLLIFDKSGFTEKEIKDIFIINENISFSKGDFKAEKTIDFKIVQDADRLDAIGAVGIARTFSFGGYKQRPFYDFESKPLINQASNQNETASTINHFYQKLLLLEDKMNLPESKLIAKKRTIFLHTFLEQFEKEVNG